MNELKMVRGIKDNDQPSYSYDVEHEKRRKEQLVKLWDRTEEEAKEEEDLKIALKRIELKRKEREKKACDLQRLINATDRTSLSPDRYTGCYKIFPILKWP
uniref:DNA methyltransferase 1-associated 1 domain-containing protein n=1 Tax=Ditylenchus dipsaci TaxID=166011 RepID=A0A915ETR4_9BILA